MAAGAQVPACLFCGEKRLVDEELGEDIEPPDTFVPFAIDEDDARKAFRKFARSSIWHPSDLRRADLDLTRLLLPSWVWSARVENHYAALVPASTRSGKRPRTGVSTVEVKAQLVPASSALSAAELNAISPFEMVEQAFDPDLAVAGFELGSLTRQAAETAGCAAMEASHGARIQADLSAMVLRSSCRFFDLRGRPILLPVFIGTYRRKDRIYRVVLNGQTGTLTGRAPISIWKVGLCLLVASVLTWLVLGGLQ
jgi:hypothetical protein